MTKITILREAENYRLIKDDQDRYAVVEVRNGRVYSLDVKDRAEAEDTPAGMIAVVGPKGWGPEPAARRRFRSAVRQERRLGEVIW